jgi:hypothetical protein
VLSGGSLREGIVPLIVVFFVHLEGVLHILFAILGHNDGIMQFGVTLFEMISALNRRLLLSHLLILIITNPTLKLKIGSDVIPPPINLFNPLLLYLLH